MNELNYQIQWENISNYWNNVAQSWDIWVLLIIIIYYLLFFIIPFILKSLWLYLINKKLWEKHAWLSFIPIIKIYSIIKVSWKPVKFILYPFLIAILLILISSILGIVALANWLKWLAIFLNIFLTILICLYPIYKWILLIHSISLRTGRWIWSTIGLIFIPIIMYPIIGFTLKKPENIKVKEKADEIKNEFSDEL